MPPDPPAANRALSAALLDLERLARDQPDRAPAAASLARALQAAFGIPDPEPLSLEPAAAETAWSQGQPAFCTLDIALPALTLRARGLALGEAARPDHPGAPALQTAIASGSVNLAALGWHLLRGETVDPPADPALDLDLLASVLRLALLPSLAPATAALAQARPEPLARWGHGDCPGCGSPPLLAEARGLEQARFLRCGTCALGWPTGRLACAACGHDDAARRRTLAVAGEEARARLQVCDACGFRLKVLSTLGPLSAPGLVVAELSLVHLDWID